MSEDGDMYTRARKHVHAGVCMYDGHDSFRMAEMVHACIHVGVLCLSWGHVYASCVHVVHACEHAICLCHAAVGTHHACLQLCAGMHVLVMWTLGQGMRCGDA